MLLIAISLTVHLMAAPQNWFERTQPYRTMTGFAALTDADIAMLERAWTDGEWQLREAALRVIGARLSPVRMMVPQASRANDLARLSIFRERAFAALDDPQPNVRAAGIEAATGFHVGPYPGMAGRSVVGRFEPPEVLAQRLVRMAMLDPAPRVRRAALLVVTLAALSDPLMVQVREAVAKAAADDDEELAFVALQHAARLEVTAAVPAIARRLAHADRGRRTNAAMALGRFGPSAAPALADLERALTIETDFVTRKSIESAIAAIKK